MKLLLDTHIILWSLGEPQRLGPRVRRILEKPATELWLSPISAWEILLLSRSGRIHIVPAFDEWMSRAVETLSLQEAPLTVEVVLAAADITLPHADPADRLLAATARYYDLKLVTADERLLEGSGFPSLPNR